MPAKKRPASFANTLADLEALVDRLEDNDIPLEQSLKDFEDGVQLIRQAQKALQEAGQKVQMLMDQAGEPVAVPLQDDNAGDDEDEEDR